MPFVYVPILKAKKGELDALDHLSVRASNGIIPWFDVPRLDENTRLKCIERSEPPVETFLNKTASSIARTWIDKSVFIDFPRWATNAQTESGEHIIPHFHNRLEFLGVAVNPVIEYGSWGDPVYINAFKNINLQKESKFCIRLNMDVDTIEDMADPEYFSDRLSDIVNQLEIIPLETYLLIDFGDVSNQAHSIEEIINKAKQAISLVQKLNFSQIILSGSSLPSSIDNAVKAQNSTGLVLRKEMMVWRALLQEQPSLNIIFSDYGIRNPNSNDESIPVPNSNGKIRYTIDKQYFIARGYSLNIGLKYQQFHTLAKAIVNSGYYFGEELSWGDKQILSYCIPKLKGYGNQTTWIAIDTNHHIETVVMEVLEFHRQLAAMHIRMKTL